MKRTGLAAACLLASLALAGRTNALTSAYLEWREQPQTGAGVYGAWTALSGFATSGENPITLGGPGAPAGGGFTPQEVVFRSAPGPLLTKFADATAKGRSAGALRIQLAQPAQSGSPRAFTELDYQGVFFTRVGLSADAGEMQDIEVRFVFTRMTWRVSIAGPTGAADSPDGVTIDVAANRVTDDANGGVIVTGALLGAGGSDPTLDSDGDGMPDQWESQHGLDPEVNDAHANPDGDPFDNLDEYLAGTDPQSANSYLRIEGLVDPLHSASPQLSWSSVAGKTYEVLYSAGGLDAASFQVIQTVTATGADTSVALPATTAPRGFYRIRVKVP